MGLHERRGDARPFYITPEGEEVPAVFVVGGHLALVPTSNDEDELTFDTDSGALVEIEWVHHQVHAGEMFHAEHSYGTVANNNNADMRFRTGAKRAHSVFLVGNGGQCQLYLYEAANISGGTSVAVNNMNRNSAHVPATVVTYAPTVTNVGTAPLVDGRVLPGGTNPNSRVGGGVRSGTEWELKPNTEYLFRVNNNSGAGIVISIGVEFYEEAV